MSDTPSTRAQNVWETQGNNDFLQMTAVDGTVLSWIDSQGYPRGALNQSGQLGIQSLNVLHTVTSGEIIANEISISYEFDTPYLDMNFVTTYGLQLISGGAPFAYLLYVTTSVSESGGTAGIFVDPNLAIEGDVIQLGVMAIHN